MIGKNQRLNGKLIETLKTLGLKDIICDSSEFGLDLILDSEMAKNIPIINTFANLYNYF